MSGSSRGGANFKSKEGVVVEASEDDANDDEDDNGFLATASYLGLLESNLGGLYFPPCSLGPFPLSVEGFSYYSW